MTVEDATGRRLDSRTIGSVDRRPAVLALHSAVVRERICQGLGSLGIELNEERNAKNAPLISTDGGRVAVRVIRTDEELMIARSLARVLAPASMSGTTEFR